MLHKVVMKKPPRIVKWAYGITTVPQRRGTTLPKTIASLKSAGFTAPRLFVDGVPSESGKGWENEFGLEVTTRYPNVKTFGNWLLGIIELYTRNPQADYYIMFQDDVITYSNLKEYLELVSYPSSGYITLEIGNLSPLPLRIYAGEGIGQLVFFRLDAQPDYDYDQKPNKRFQDQKGLTGPGGTGENVAVSSEKQAAR